jgi:hypothetical protein
MCRGWGRYGNLGIDSVDDECGSSSSSLQPTGAAGPVSGRRPQCERAPYSNTPAGVFRRRCMAWRASRRALWHVVGAIASLLTQQAGCWRVAGASTASWGLGTPRIGWCRSMYPCLTMRRWCCWMAAGVTQSLLLPPACTRGDGTSGASSASASAEMWLYRQRCRDCRRPCPSRRSHADGVTHWQSLQTALCTHGGATATGSLASSPPVMCTPPLSLPASAMCPPLLLLCAAHHLASLLPDLPPP